MKIYKQTIGITMKNEIKIMNMHYFQTVFFRMKHLINFRVLTYMTENILLNNIIIK